MAIYKLGELFCGPGGLAWGATNADIGLDDFKIEHAWANDSITILAIHIGATSVLMLPKV